MLIDHLINAKLTDSFETLYRARVVCVIFLAALLAFCLSAVYFFFVADLSNHASRVAGSSALLIAGALAVGVIKFYMSGLLIYTSYFLIVLLLAAIFSSILLTGGFERSPVFPLFVVPSLIAFSLLGNKAGLCFSFISVGSYWLAVWIHGKGIELPLYIDFSYRNLHLHVNWMISFAMLMALMCSTNIMYSALRYQRDEERKRYEYLAAHDSLTGLYNRMMFDELLMKAIKKSARYQTQVALLYIDLDKFKPINDDFGHRVGDIVLQELASRLAEVVRQTDTAARIGGDEFALIIEADKLEHQDLVFFIERVAAKLNEPILYSGERFNVGCSIGVACYPDDGVSAEQLVKAADDAMYAAKKADRNYVIA